MPHDLSLPDVSFDELIRNKTHKTRVEGAFLHVYNIKTGLTEFILKKTHDPQTRSALRPREIDGRVVMVEEDIQYVPQTVTVSPAFSELLIDQICTLLVEGSSLKKICSMPHMPSYATLSSWRRLMPGVRERIDEAREDRGEHLRDEAMEAVENISEDDVAVASLKHKAKVWAAGVDNSRYSPKAKIEATINQPTQIIVNTGIGQTREASPAPTPAVPENTGGVA